MLDEYEVAFQIEYDGDKTVIASRKVKALSVSEAIFRTLSFIARKGLPVKKINIAKKGVRA